MFGEGSIYREKVERKRGGEGSRKRLRRAIQRDVERGAYSLIITLTATSITPSI